MADATCVCTVQWNATFIARLAAAPLPLNIMISLEIRSGARLFMHLLYMLLQRGHLEILSHSGRILKEAKGTVHSWIYIKLNTKLMCLKFGINVLLLM